MAKMNIAEFEDLAAAFGPDPADWPADRRDAAQAFLDGADSAAARAALAEARALDVALAELAAAEVPVTLPAGLTARILADAADVTAARAGHGVAISQAPSNTGRSWLADLADMFGGWRTAAISAAACALIGLGAGYATPEAAVASLGYEDAAQEEIIVGLGWDADEVEYSMFGDAG